MLRRVARVPRVPLFALCALMVMAIPLSFVVVLDLYLPVLGGCNIGVERGYVGFAWNTQTQGFGVRFRANDALFDIERYIGPDWGLVNSWLTIPLWLLAAVCLAWPVTSLILHRRRQKRGFPVESKASESGAPKVRQ